MQYRNKTFDKMDSEVTINLGKLSQILAVVGSSSHRVGNILIEVKILSTSPDTTNEPKSQEPQKYIPCQIVEEIDNLGTTSDGDKCEIKEFSTCLTIDMTCIKEINNPRNKGLHNLKKGGDYQDYIERWFQKVTRPQYHSFLQHLLIQK